MVFSIDLVDMEAVTSEAEEEFLEAQAAMAVVSEVDLVVECHDHLAEDSIVDGKFLFFN